jgi:hypothetical protein
MSRRASDTQPVTARMAHRTAAALALWLGILGSACSSKSQPPAADPGSDAGVSGDIPCDANHVLETVCQKCHSAPPQNMAPFSLVTFADTHASNGGKPIWQYMETAVANGVMPLPPVDIEPADRDTLLRWLQAGATARAPGETCPDETVDPAADAGGASDAGPDGSVDEANASPPVDDSAQPTDPLTVDGGGGDPEASPAPADDAAPE